MQKTNKNILIIRIHHDACKIECRVLPLQWSHSRSISLTLSVHVLAPPLSMPMPCWSMAQSLYMSLPLPCNCPVLVRGPCPLPFLR